MKAAFNGTCDFCGKFLPRCALIKFRLCENGVYRWADKVACPVCRRARHSRYRLDPQHKSKKRGGIP